MLDVAISQSLICFHMLFMIYSKLTIKGTFSNIHTLR